MGNPSTIYRRESDRFFPTPRPFVEKSASSAARERCGTALPTFLHGPPTSERRPSGTVPRRGTPGLQTGIDRREAVEAGPSKHPQTKSRGGTSLVVDGVTAWNADFSRHPRAERAAERITPIAFKSVHVANARVVRTVRSPAQGLDPVRVALNVPKTSSSRSPSSENLTSRPSSASKSVEAEVSMPPTTHMAAHPKPWPRPSVRCQTASGRFAAVRPNGIGPRAASPKPAASAPS